MPKYNKQKAYKLPIPQLKINLHHLPFHKTSHLLSVTMKNKNSPMLPHPNHNHNMTHNNNNKYQNKTDQLLNKIKINNQNLQELPNAKMLQRKSAPLF